MSKACYRHIDNVHGLNTYDYGARQHDPILGRWDRIDPLCEKYYSTSPYVYCANNPVRFIDPDGRATGNYITSDGQLIGNDGIDDKNVYVLKTSEKSFDSYGNAPVAGISSKEAKKIIKEKDISNPDNFVKLDGSKETRSAVIAKIGDDGTGGTSDANNSEYKVTFDANDPNPTVYSQKGVAGELGKDPTISVEMGSNPNVIKIHSHASGTNVIGKKLYSWSQAPSRQDVENSKGDPSTRYVIATREKRVYMYNGTGILGYVDMNIYQQ